MCGIAGVVTWDLEHSRIERQTLERMGHAIAHRGPDGRDLWMDDRCGLAFARLAVLDPDPRAMQPMTDGKRWLVFNGEIYNFRELRSELDKIAPGYAWKTTGDSEVILRAYGAWGEKCVEKFNGMFALAIWEPLTGSIFLARDRMGQKPLYFALRPGRALAFASELAALRAVPWIESEIDLNSVAEYLQTGYIAAPATIYRGVAKLPPASWMRCTASGATEPRKYFDPNEIAPDERPATVESIKSAVVRAVGRQLISDVPLGCFLSGGIDSSVIALAMKKSLGNQPVLTFSIGFDEAEYDETQYAAAVARHLGTDHRKFTVCPDAAEDLPKLAKVFGEPFGDSSALSTHYLSREMRGFVKVALSGDGGDELFGGYDRYRAMRWGNSGQKIPALFRRFAAALPSQHPKSTLAKARRFIAALGLPPPERYAEYVGLFDRDLAAQLFPAQSARRNIVAGAYAHFAGSRGLVQAALATDRITYLPEDLLTKLDRASMLHGLEVRSPFMDHELVRLAAGLSTEQLLKGGPKRMLREAFTADLPEFVFRRRKMGFAVPIGQWLRESLRPMMEDLLGAKDSFASAHFQKKAWRDMIDNHCAKKADHSQRLYSLLMLELWWRQH